MKTKYDPRHKQRVEKLKQLFAYSFRDEEQKIIEKISDISPYIEEIDKMIQEVAPEWPVKRLNKIDLAILRLSVYELMIDRKTPPKVIIDEAVEIGKEYGSESTAKFVNGVLGSLLKKRDKEQEK